MKYVNKISVLLSLLAVTLFSACNADQEGPLYTESNGLSFVSSTLNPLKIVPDSPTFTVDLLRSNTEGDLTGSVKVSASMGDTAVEGVTVSDYAFTDGENTASITIDVSVMSIGETITVGLALDSEDVSVGGYGETSVDVTMDYSWQSIGTGSWQDGIISSLYTGGGIDPSLTWEVEVEQAVENPAIYRAVDPYGFEICPYVAESEVVNGGPFYVQIDTTDPDNVLVPQQSLGIDWGEGTFVIGSMYYLDGTSRGGVKTGNVINLGTSVFAGMGTSAYLTSNPTILTLPAE